MRVEPADGGRSPHLKGFKNILKDTVPVLGWRPANEARRPNEMNRRTVIVQARYRRKKWDEIKRNLRKGKSGGTKCIYSFQIFEWLIGCIQFTVYLSNRDIG